MKTLRRAQRSTLHGALRRRIATVDGCQVRWYQQSPICTAHGVAHTHGRVISVDQRPHRRLNHLVSTASMYFGGWLHHFFRGWGELY